jgi:hypothetical protein
MENTPTCGAKIIREGSYHHELIQKKRIKGNDISGIQ